MERRRAAERGALGMCTGWIEQRYSDDVVYRVTEMVMQYVCDVLVLG
jgi:hypothetical protein